MEDKDKAKVKDILAREDWENHSVFNGCQTSFALTE